MTMRIIEPFINPVNNGIIASKLYLPSLVYAVETKISITPSFHTCLQLGIQLGKGVIMVCLAFCTLSHDSKSSINI